jgi:hypothetical protein
MHYVLPQTKKIISRTFKIRGTLVFLCPKERDKDRVRARKGKKKGKEKEKRKGKRKGKGQGTGKGKIFLKVRKNMLNSLDIYILYIVIVLQYIII